MHKPQPRSFAIVRGFAARPLSFDLLVQRGVDGVVLVAELLGLGDTLGEGHRFDDTRDSAVFVFGGR